MALEGLAALKARKQADKEREEARNRPKAEWFTSVFGKPTAKGGIGDVAEVVFLQELDDAAAGYNADRGLGKVEVEHHGPGKEGFKKRANCTVETEGQCYACERHRQNYEEGWRQRTNLYINVAANVDGEWKPFVLTRNFNSSFMDQLMQEAEDEGTITDKVFRITKTGSGTTTSWIPKRLKEDAPDLSDVDVFDIDETVLRKIPYADQPKWYLGEQGNAAKSDEETARPAGTAAGADDEW